MKMAFIDPLNISYRLAAAKQHDAGFDEFICGYHSYDRTLSPVSISKTGFQDDGDGLVPVDCWWWSCGGDGDDIEVDKRFRASVGVLYNNKR